MKFSKMILGAAVSLLTVMAGAQNPALASGAQGTEITILHTNDLHGRITQGLGLAEVATMVEEFRLENPNTLLFDAGDTVHGLPIVNLFEGRSMIDLMNAIGFDAMAAGNHDFNFGLERLLELNEAADFPIMGANVVRENGDSVLDGYEIFEKDGVRIGVFGLATPETMYRTHPRNVAGIQFASPSEVAAELVAHLQPQTDIIIALGHLGVNPSSFYTSLAVINQVPGIDLFIDGHSHTLFAEGTMVGDTLLVSTGAHNQHFGVVNLVVQDGELSSANARTISEAEANAHPSERILNMVSEFQADVEEMGREVIGATSVRLEGDRVPVRTGETNLGSLSADIILAATDADISMINSGSIRDSIEAGPITMGDIQRVFAFGGLLEVRLMTGEAILEALEHGTRNFPNEDGGFPQVGGVRFDINTSNPAGSRVENVYIGGQPLDLTREYRLAVGDFMGGGGDGYTMIAAAPMVGEFMDVREAIIAYFVNHEGSVAPAADGRIRVTDGTEQNEIPTPEVRLIGNGEMTLREDWHDPNWPQTIWFGGEFSSNVEVNVLSGIENINYITVNKFISGRPEHPNFTYSISIPVSEFDGFVIEASEEFKSISMHIWFGDNQLLRKDFFLNANVIPPATYSQWDALTIFNAGERVIYNGTVFEAQWWTQNQAPGDVWGPWMEISRNAETGFYYWTASRVFDYGDIVIYDGQAWRARWWTRNQRPGPSWGPWKLN